MKKWYAWVWLPVLGVLIASGCSPLSFAQAQAPPSTEIPAEPGGTRGVPPVNPAPASDEGRIQPAGDAESIATPTGVYNLQTESVAGWLGYVVRTPHGAQFDDYFVLLSDETVRLGLEGATEAIRTEIEGLRDTGIYCRVLGQARFGEPNAYGSQIEVTRLVASEVLPLPDVDTEAVAGWVGTVGRFSLGNQLDRYFERSDRQRFGIFGMNDAVRELISEAAWTGAQVKVWGSLLTNVPDVENRQVQVEQIELLSGLATEARDLSPFATVRASSELPRSRKGTYAAFFALDGLPETTWTEGVAGAGVGEWIALEFPGTVEIHSIGIDVGYDKSDDLFYANNRLKRATLIFSSGEQIDLIFADKRGVQRMPLVRAPSPNIETTYVRIVIQEVYPGSRYDDTCLSEIKVWGGNAK